MLGILVLCTGNSARSILAEALLNSLGEGRVRAYSAGSMPKGQVNPHAFPVTRALGFEDAAFRSEAWDEFAAPGAPKLDLVITVCDSAAAEACPVWPGGPATIHWGIPDTAAVTGSGAEIDAAFQRAARQLRRRIESFLALPLEDIGRPGIQARAREIGAQPDPDA